MPVRKSARLARVIDLAAARESRRKPSPTPGHVRELANRLAYLGGQMDFLDAAATEMTGMREEVQTQLVKVYEEIEELGTFATGHDPDMDKAASYLQQAVERRASQRAGRQGGLA